MSDHYRYADALVSCEWLAAHLDDEELRIFECTTWLDYLPEGADAPYEVRSGRAEYDEGHIDGAGFLDIQGELSDISSPRHLRFTMPAPDVLAQAFSARGVGDESRVVLYSRGAPSWATRVWWVLRSIGFDGAAVLDGGFEKWSREKRPISTAAPDFTPATLTPRPREGLFVSKEAVVAAMDDPNTCIVNALTSELHRGEINRYGRAGHIPGSVNVPATSLVDAQARTFLPAASVAEMFREVGADRDRRTIFYCGGGIAATVDAFLLHQLGYSDLAVYDASMSEWARDESLPIETG